MVAELGAVQAAQQIIDGVNGVLVRMQLSSASPTAREVAAAPGSNPVESPVGVNDVCYKPFPATSRPCGAAVTVSLERDTSINSKSSARAV